MGIFDVLKGNQYKKEADDLRSELTILKSQKMSVEQLNSLQLKEDIINSETKLIAVQNNIKKQKEELSTIESFIVGKQIELQKLERQLIVAKDDIRFESVGLYHPKYNFASSLGYKEKLSSIRDKQKQLIKSKDAVNFSTNWTVDGSLKKGQKMNNDNIKQILRSFNNECEAAINKIKYSNVDSIEKRIKKSFEQLNKLNISVKVSIKPIFLDLKLDEMHLAYEYELKKQEEKEELRAQREKEREEKALQKEIESQKKKIDKDITHYKNMVEELKNKLSSINDENERISIETQINELNENVESRNNEKNELDYRNAHASAGYVYIISNIGAFGEDVVKIGVTRRLDPLDRISELSSASVPFKFDVHALIFSYEAYKLESELHKKYDAFRINKVNMRKEFFKVPIQKIENDLQEYKDLTIDFSEIPDAEEYNQSVQLNRN